jgi:dsRNA-specific ribonuclease
LKASYQARVALLRDQIVQSTDDKIRRMRQSQFGTATADYERRLAEILEAESRTDIISQVVAYGVLVVKEDINE